MSHDKGTNVSRETSRGAGEGEELRESRWNTADAPRSPATPAIAPRRFSHHPGGPSPATAHTVAQLLGQRQGTPLSHRRHLASGRTTPRRCPGLAAPRPRGRAAPRRRRPPRTRGISSAAPPPQRAIPRRRRPRSARRLASSSPAAAQYLAAALASQRPSAPRPHSTSPLPRPHGASPAPPVSQHPAPADARHFANGAPAAPSASRYLASSGPDAARIGRRADARPRGVRLARAGLSRT